MLLAASSYFYMVFQPIYIIILLVTIIIDYYAGIFIHSSEGKKRKFFLVISLMANIGVLAVFKYYNFFIDNFNSVLPSGVEFSLLSILLPVGLSFHTFQAMSYTIEIYNRNYKPERHFGYYALYVMYFPQLVAGPIERPQNIIYQLKKDNKLKYQNISDGIKLILYGLVKKAVIADNISGIVDSYYNSIPGQNNSILAIFLFSIQIYCDFSGYSDIAIGSSKLMGIDLMKNFNFPYFSKSVTEFWRRWHISLSNWFRDYLYMPLGGNKFGKLLHYRNILIVFSVSGLWHGANWTFVAWGFFYGIILIFENYLKVEKYTKTIITFSLVSILWIFFRAANFDTAFIVFNNIFSSSFDLSVFTLSNIFYIMIVLLFLSFEWYIKNEGFLTFFNKFNYWTKLTMSVVLVYIILILGTFEKSQFIYFQF